MLTLHRRADPTVFGPVELSFLTSDELIKIKRRKYPSESKPVGLGDAVHMVCRDHGAGTCHVLDDKSWIAGNVFRHVLADQPRPGVVNITGRKAGYNSYCFSLVIRRLGMNRDGAKEKQNYQ